MNGTGAIGVLNKAGHEASRAGNYYRVKWKGGRNLVEMNEEEIVTVALNIAYAAGARLGEPRPQPEPCVEEFDAKRFRMGPNGMVRVTEAEQGAGPQGHGSYVRRR